MKRKKGLFLLLIFAGIVSACTALVVDNGVNTVALWAKTYGGTNSDYVSSIAQTSDGGYVIAGYTQSFGAGLFDIMVIKLDGTGAITWQKTYGGTNNDFVSSIAQTSDGGYVIAGNTYSFGSGGSDAWILKLDGIGAITWQKTFGETNYDSIYSIAQTSDSGYIITGSTYSFGSGGSDAWILKLDGTGAITWQKTFGGTNNDYANMVVQTSDSGYIIAGSTYSFGSGGFDAWIIKLDGSGSTNWQKIYGGTNQEHAKSVAQTSDGGYVLAGQTMSYGTGYYDAWILKLDGTGAITWQKTYGSTLNDEAISVMQTSDGGYLIGGKTYYFGAGDSDLWLFKLDSTGAVTWEKTYGGTNTETFRSFKTTSDGKYIVAGLTQSFGAGLYDYWVFKSDVNGNLSGAGFVNNSSASVSNSAATVGNTTNDGVNSAATVGDTAVTGVNSSAIIDVQYP